MFIFITDHACERYMERIDNTIFDFKQIRYKITSLIRSNKHKVLIKDKKRICILIGDLITIFDKTKKVLITLYPATERAILRKLYIKEVKMYECRFEKLKIKNRYIEPTKLSFGHSNTKPFYFLTITDNDKNLSGCYSSAEKVQKFIDDYTTFYSKVMWLRR